MFCTNTFHFRFSPSKDLWPIHYYLLFVFTRHKSSKITFKISLLLASEMLTFKEHSILKKQKFRSWLLQHMFRCVEILLFPSDLIKASNNIRCATFFFAQLRGSQIKEKKQMLEITVIKEFELIITLNNHNFLFNYSHSTQWKLSFPPDFSLTFLTLKNYNNKKQLTDS